MKWNVAAAALALVLAGCRTSGGTHRDAAVAGAVVERDELQRFQERLAKGPLTEEEADTFFLVAQQLLAERKVELAERFFVAVFEVKPTLVVGLRLSEILLLTHRYEEAERVVQRLFALFPKSPDPAVALSRVQFVQGRNDDALRTLKQAYETNPGVDAVAAPYVELLVRQGKDADARRTLESLVKGPNANPYFLQKLAELDIKQKRFADAKVLLDRLLRAAPENVEGWTLAGFLAMEEKDTAAAERYFREAYLKQPDNDALARYYVLQLLKQDKYREARRILVKLEGGGEPGKGLDPELTFQLGFVFYQLDEFDEARKRFLSLVDKVDDPGRPLFFSGQCEEELKLGDEALASYARIPEKSPFYRQGVVRSMYVLLEAGKSEEARGLLSKIGIRADSDESDYRALALIQARLRDYAKALEVAREGLKKFPESVDLAYHAATWLEHTESREEAMEAMEKFIVKNPDHPQALNYLAYSLAESNMRLDEALRRAEKAVSLQPKDPFFLDTLGWVYFRLGRLNEAELHLVRALSIEPEEPIIYEHLGEVSLARKDPAAALKHFEMAERKFAAQPAWKVEGDREWKESRRRVAERIQELRRKALP